MRGEPGVMMREHEASRTLVKSPPELWAECSDPGSLARHLGEFGEITITRLEPENAVAWEGEHASGTVRIEPSGWGTRVTLTAQTKGEPEPEPEEPAADPVAEGAIDPETDSAEEADDATLEETLEDSDPVPTADAGTRIRWRRLKAVFRRRKPGLPGVESDEAPDPQEDSAETLPEPEAAVDPEPEAAVEPDPEPEVEPSAEPELDAELILTSALDSLGQAHHRPFSRA